MKTKNHENHGPVTLGSLASAGFNFGMPVPTTVLVDALVGGSE